MRVGILSFHADRSGVPLYSRNLFELLSRAGIEVDILTAADGHAFSGLDASVIKIHGIHNSFSPINFVRAVFTLRQVVRKGEFDTIIVGGMLFGTIARLFINSCRVIFVHHGLSFDPGFGSIRRNLFRALEVFCLNFTRSENVVISTKNRDSLEALKFNPFGARIRLLRNSISSRRSQSANYEKLNGSFGRVDLVCAASFRPQKNHRLLFKSFNLLKDNYNLFLLGEGTDSLEIKKIAEQFVRKDALSRIEFIGEVQNVYPYLNELSIGVLTSLYEGLPLFGLECLDAGRPMVMTNVSGADDIIGDGAGVIAKTMDPKEVCMNLVNVGDSIIQGKWDRRNSWGRFDREFSYSRFEKDWISLVMSNGA